MGRPKFLALLGIFVLAVIVRMFCLADEPFFCDVGGLIAAITDGRMRIQFPGYVPYCLLIKGLTFLMGTPFAGMLLLSFLGGMGAMIYTTLFAYDRGGFPGALVASVVMGFFTISVYYSCVGTYYETEMLAMSAMIYHGNRMLTKNEAGHYYGVLGWYIFGCLMRSLSFPLTGLGLLFLLWKRPVKREIVATAVALILSACFFLAVSLAYFGGFHQMWATQLEGGILRSSGRPFWLLLNWLRLGTYLFWGLNVFLLLGAGVLWFSRRHLNGSLRTFLLLLTVPYICILLRYIPTASYTCLLFPALVCAPWVAERRFWLDTRPVAVALVVGSIFLVQVFLAHPIATKGPVSLVANVYCFMYTRTGIKSCMNESLKHLAVKTHVAEQYISLSRGNDDHSDY